ncbi:signal transducer and activator of transcription 5B-like isoform X4 [Dreissena polymorpha]|uniref:signal transducer and activator of transcription 5B-like isoform X4 n=1 Tax=Dreissena polymorpha TaxID=45954 RepID=UPI002264CF0E|nr:signal transducer and activator of transcription 5B-like isoform X4 [Dreissena polymorpha]
MALWARTQQLPPEALKQVQQAYSNYNNFFPIEVRHFFAPWIEDQNWNAIDVNLREHEVFAKQLLENLVQLIDQKANVTEDFLGRLQFQDFAQKFQEHYGDQPLRFVYVVKMFLGKEEELLKLAPDSVAASEMFVRTEAQEKLKRDIKQQTERIDRSTQEADTELRDMHLLQEKFVIDYQTHAQMAARLARVQCDGRPPEEVQRLQQTKEQMDRMLLQSAQTILQQRLALAEKHKKTLTEIEQLQKKVVDEELISWKRKQQLCLNGAPFDTSLIDTLQGWCESLADLIWRNRQQILRVDSLRQQLPIEVPEGYSDIQPELNQAVTSLLSSLVTSTFIVEQQPPQVLKTSARFSATVRLLVGGKLNLNMFPPRVKATIISEQQAKILLQNVEPPRGQKCGEILNNEGQMDFHNATGQLSVVFRNMTLKNIKRADKRGGEVHAIAEEKFCIHFTSEFNVGGNELKFQTLSLPVIVTVHGNQECQATATFIWDNQFSEPGRIPFQVPDSAPWIEVAKMLSTKFHQMTGRALTEDNLRYIGTKLFGQTGNMPPDPTKIQIRWHQFNRENLPGRNFTFWEWFWAVAKLVKEQLKSPWMDGLIIGFMDRQESNDMLLTKPNGTFLLRFSDTTLGGITIAWVANSNENVDRQVWNLAPFTIKDFAIRGLADRIKDLPALVNLYPDTPKNDAFAKYFTPATGLDPNQEQSGYVKSTLVLTVLDGQSLGAHGGGTSYYDVHTPLDGANPLSPGSDCWSSAMTPRPENATACGDTMMDDGSRDLPVTVGDLADTDFNNIKDWLLSIGSKAQPDVM